MPGCTRNVHDAIVANAIDETGLQRLRRQVTLSLSGGERQRAAAGTVLGTDA